MDAAELTRLIQELEDRVERLRALYEQYFMGLERIEPLTLRKEVDRRLWMLRREQIRNTGTRFKLQTVVQRYNTYQQYWQRIVREIESGTYQRDLGRAAQRFGEAATTALGRRRQKMFEKGQARRSERDAHRQEGQQGQSGAPPDGGVAVAAALAQGNLSTAARPAGVAASQSSQAPEPSDAFDEDVPIDDSEMFQDAEPLTEQSRHSATLARPAPLPPRTSPASAAEPAPEKRAATGALGALVRMPSERAPGLPRRAGTSAAPTAHAGAKPAVAPPATLPRPAATSLPRPPASGSGRGVALGASGAPPPAPTATPNSTMLFAGGAARTAGPGGQAVPAMARIANPASPGTLGHGAPGAATAPAATAPRGPVPASALPGAAGTRAPAAAANAVPVPLPVPVAAAPRSAVAAPSATRTAPQPAAPPKVTAPGAPLPAAARPAPPPAADENGLSTSRLRQIYGAYVDAKRQANESTAAITYDKVAANLRETAMQLRGKHQGREIDFEVVLKNGKPVLKPVLKG